MTTSLGPLEPMVESVTRINIAGWRPTEGKQLRLFNPDIWNLYRMRSQDAPRLSRAELRLVASQLPIRNPDIIFAGRLCSAVILQDLINESLLSTFVRVVDYDDIMSKFRLRQARMMGPIWGRQFKLLAQVDSRVIAVAERRIARTWHGVSVCTDEDAATLRAANPDAAVVKIPNIVTRKFLPPRATDGYFRVLFAGNLSFSPNSDGLRIFVEQAWPALLRVVPEARLTIVGMRPPWEIVEMAQQHGFALHADVSSLLPYYEKCDVVIAPILFGSGTRVKILEALAYGRAVVSTPLGAEGMGLQQGRHILIADTMAEFAAALATLAHDPGMREAIVLQARAFQQAHYTSTAINAALAKLLSLGHTKADPQPKSRAA